MSILTDDVSLQIFMEQLKISVSLFVFFAWFSSFCSLSGSLVPLALSVPRSRPHCLPRPPPTHTHTHTHTLLLSLPFFRLARLLRPCPFCSPSCSLALSFPLSASLTPPLPDSRALALSLALALFVPPLRSVTLLLSVSPSPPPPNSLAHPHPLPGLLYFSRSLSFFVLVLSPTPRLIPHPLLARSLPFMCLG